jgi:mannose-1-phosphate guanylyltransferase/mannose-6-phosphate isomerase
MNLDFRAELGRRSTKAGATIVPVILSGGSGTRLWPVSRESFPKQFWPLASEKSLIAETALRTFGGEFSPPLIVCNEAHRFMVAEQLREAEITGARILLEPVGRNSAPAIAAAALVLSQDDPQAVICMMAADAAIPDAGPLRAALLKAAKVAQTGRVVTLGMRPTRPETGFGYIEMGPALAEAPDAHALQRFIEKPDANLAGELIATGRVLWNSGIFVFTVSTLLEELQTHAPHVLATARRAVEARTTDLDFIRLGRDEFMACPNISLDYAVAEHTTRAAVIAVECAVGSGSQGCDRQCRGRRCHAGGCPELLCAQRRHPDRRPRAGGRGRRRDRGRRARHAPRPGARRKEGRRAAAGAVPPRGDQP